MSVQVEMKIKLPIELTKKERWYVASCPILDVHSQGETKKLARHNLIEALTVFFESCITHGTLDAVLKECGFRPAQKPVGKRRNISRADYINIPIPLMVNTIEANQCHV